MDIIPKISVKDEVLKKSKGPLNSHLAITPVASHTLMSKMSQVASSLKKVMEILNLQKTPISHKRKKLMV